MKKIIPQSLKNIYHLFQAVFANVWFGFPSKKLKVIGVTGTNGKTTTVQMIAKVLEEAGKKIAVASTINFKLGEKEWVNKSKFTTLSSFAVQKFLKQAVAAGCEYVVLEVSSHSLDQNRVWGVDFDAAVITNVTREHLDYHETMEEYAKVKEKLFAGLGKSGKSVAVVNMGMKFAKDFLKYPADEKYGYRIKYNVSSIMYPGMKIVEAEQVKLNIHNTSYIIHNTLFTLNMPGEFNIENALAATCVGMSQNIPLEKISAALAKIKGVPGRMERIDNSRDLNIIVDYAVTPDSLEKLYRFISEFAKRSDRAAEEESGRTAKIIAVFGSCGERDRGKRPIMGEIVAQHADCCIVTNEDPYNEDPQQIIDEVFAGVVGRDFPKARLFSSSSEALEIPQSQALENSEFKTEGVDAFRILDRRDAIKKALQIAKPGDIVVVTGKGAEEIMVIGKERISWNDPKVIREVLREIQSEKNQ
jgi:UDP-N-acetylmuramoyl-L-alanyl-D-glutamate--2,6-diaminopimelate ligase